MRRNLRGAVMLAITMLAAGALAVTPAFSAAPLTRAKVKKIARKIAKKEAAKAVNTLGPGLFIEEGEMFRFHFGMDVGQPERTVGTFGPFTFKATCTQPAANADAQLLIATSEANSIFNSDETWEPDFDPSDSFLIWDRSASEPPGGAAYNPTNANVGHAASASGTGILGFTPVYNNVGGFDCYFQGYLVTTTRTA